MKPSTDVTGFLYFLPTPQGYIWDENWDMWYDLKTNQWSDPETLSLIHI